MTDIVRGSIRKITEANGSTRLNGYMVPVTALHVREGFNSAREADPGHAAYVRELADSIKGAGFKRDRPLIVTASADGKLYVNDGHTRLSAVMLANTEGAGIEALPVIDEAPGTSEDDRIAGLILNNSGRPLTQMGQAEVVKRLVGRGLSEDAIAAKVGMSVAKVRDLLTLTSAPVEIREMVTAGEVSPTLAVQVLKTDGADAVATLKTAKARSKAKGKKKVTKQDVTGQKRKVRNSKPAQLSLTVADVRKSIDPVISVGLTDKQIAAVLQAVSEILNK